MGTLIEIPRFEDVLPVLATFIDDLIVRIQSNEIDTAGKADRAIEVFFTDDELHRLEDVIPGWLELVDYEGRKTLSHVVTALASLPDYEEYNRASETQQNIVTWALLYHDIAKRSKHERDFGHAFRSAVTTARNLPSTGVDLPESYHSGIDSWSELTLAAIEIGSTDRIQVDNDSLPRIVAQLDTMLAKNSASNRIIKIVLFHHSINTLRDWPQLNPLTETEVLQYFDRELLDLMRIMQLADNDGWELFHAENCRAYRTETRGVFQHLEQLITP